MIDSSKPPGQQHPYVRVARETLSETADLADTTELELAAFVGKLRTSAQLLLELIEQGGGQ